MNFAFQLTEDGDFARSVKVRPTTPLPLADHFSGNSAAALLLFARYLNTSESTVEKWETGAKKPSGAALKLLSIVQKHGLQILA